jgi:hypothetical protein
MVVEVGLQSRTTPSSIFEAWHLSPFDYIKINVDAIFVESICDAIVGVVTRNSADDIVVSSWDYIGSCTSVDEAELRAVSSWSIYWYHSP